MSTNNAQPRLRRHDPDVLANDAARFLADPVMAAQCEALETRLVDMIVSAADGTPDGDHKERHYVDQLRALRALRSGLQVKPQLQEMREQGFTPTAKAESERGTPAPYQPGIRT